MASISIQLNTIDEANELYLSAMVKISERIHLPTKQERAALPIWKQIQSEAAQAMESLNLPANDEFKRRL